MALENDDLPKVPDKQQGTIASGVATKIVDEKPPKPMKEKTNLEELDEIELETLLKETITYKSPRDRDCRSSLFNKLLVSAEDSIRKDSALNASGSEAVRHRNPQAATSRRSRYHHNRAGTNHTLHLHHAGDGKHGSGAGGGRGGRDCGGEVGDGGSIAEKGGLGGSLNNLTVEDLYESISQHLQQRPEKSVSARQRTGGSLPCNVNAGLITPCETPPFATDRKSSTNPFNATNPQQQNSSATPTTSTTTTTISTSPTTTTCCLTSASFASNSSNSSSIVYGLSSTNTRVDDPVPGTSATDAAPQHHHQSSGASASSAIASGGGGSGKDCCVIEVELEEEETGATGGIAESTTADMIGIKPSNQSANPSKPPLPPTSTANAPIQFNNNNNPTTSTILSASNNPLLDCAAYNIPHIDDDDIVEEQAYQQRQQYQHKLNSYTLKQPQTQTTVDVVSDAVSGTELQPICKSATTNDSTTLSDCTTSSDVGCYYLGNNRRDQDKQQRDRADHVERRPLLKLCDIDLEAGVSWGSGRAVGRVTGGGGPMKIIGQGPQIKHSTADSLHKQLLSSTLNPLAHTSSTTSTSSSSSRPTSLEDPAITLPSTAAIHHLPSLSHHHSAQQPHHQHTGAVRIPSLSSTNMLNLNSRRLQQQQRDGDAEDGADGEMVIGVPSTLTGTMERETSDRGNSKNFFSERTIHVADVVESPASYRQSDLDSTPTCEFTKNYGAMASKKIDDGNGNHITKPRKKMKPETFVLAQQVEGHRGDIALGDINTVVAFICGNGDNVAKPVKTARSSVKLQQHRASVSGANNRAGGKSVDAEHHSHSRRHQNHHGQHNQQNQAQIQQTNSKKLHRANSLEEMPTTTLEEFHENESKHKQNNNNIKQNSANNNKQVAANKVSSTNNQIENLSLLNSHKKTSTSDSNNAAASANSVVESSSSVGVNVTNNRGRGVLRATKSNAEKSGGSRSGGSTNRGSVTRASGAEGAAVTLQPRRSWTNADPSPLQAIQHSATSTASAENLETDFTLVNSKKKKGKKQQQRRNSVGSRTPINTTQTQTITSPPGQQQQQQHQRNYNNKHNSNNNYNNNSSGGSIVVNLATLVQSSASSSGNAAASSVPHSDKSNGDCSSSDGDSVHSLPIDAFTLGSRQHSPPNLTSYASITKNNVATQAVQSTPKWPTTTAPTTTTTIMLTSSNSVVSSTNSTTTATVVHPENVVVAVQVKVVTNRSQEQQTDDIPPTLLFEAATTHSAPELPIVVQLVNALPREEAVPSSHPVLVSSSDAPSLNDMQRWPSINNNNNSKSDQAATSHDSKLSAAAPPTTSGYNIEAPAPVVGNTWPSLKQNNSKQTANIPVVSAANMDAKDEVKIVPSSERVVVRSTSVNKQLIDNNNKVSYMKQQTAPYVERIIVKDDRLDLINNKVNNSRQQHSGGGVGIIVQNHHHHQYHAMPLHQQTVVHPVLVTQLQHAPQTIIPLIPITKIPPPNLIDHTTPPPPNFIPNVNHISYQPQQQQQQQQMIVNHPPQNNNVVYTQPQVQQQQLPANIPDVQMIEHQLQLQHNNNNIHAKNSYNQQTNEYKVSYSSSTNKQQQPAGEVDFAAAKRPAVVIMRGNSNDLNISSPLGDPNVPDDCELTFGFDVNEELLLSDDRAAVTNMTCSEQATVDEGVDDVEANAVLPAMAKDVSMMFVSRFIVPDCCAIQTEFNYEKIVDFVENAWHEAVSETSDGKCNFYQDL